MEGAVQFLQENGGVISTVIGFVLMFVAKAVPNSKAGPAVAKLQAVVDGLAKFAGFAVVALSAVSKILENSIKSDGYFGKK